MNKLKPYIIGAMVGIISMLAVGALGYVALKKTKPFIKKVISKLSDLKFNNTKRSDEELVIADFESKEDFDKFSEADVVYSVANDFASHGSYSAKLTYKKSSCPSYRLDTFFEKNKKFSNWAPYGSLLFDVYNPSNKSNRVILQIKDSGGNRYKQDIELDANSKQTIEVEISVLRESVSPYRIAQVNLFQWKPGADSVIYIDYFRLVPQSKKIVRSIFGKEFLDDKKPIYSGPDYFYFPKDKWARGEKTEVPIFVLNPTQVTIKDFPVKGGVPFPRGELVFPDKIIIRGDSGEAVSFQPKVMARWPDGSIKWLLIEMPARAPALGFGKYSLFYPEENAAQDNKSFVTETPDEVIVDTGKIKFNVNKHSFKLFDKVLLNNKKVLSSEGDLTIQFRGEVYKSSNDKDYKLTIEEAGPRTVGLKAEGWFVNSKGQKFCKFLVRIKAFKDESFVKVYHTFIYTGYPENRYHYLYKGKRLPKNETIEDVGISLNTTGALSSYTFSFAGDGKVFQKDNLSEKCEILQLKDDSFVVLKNEKEKAAQGRKLEGWVDISSGDVGVSVVIRKLWQQYPKGFSLEPKKGIMEIKLWPKEAGELDLKTTDKAEGPEAVARGSAFGLAKTHELTFYFHEGNYNSAGVRYLNLVSQRVPLIISASEWLNDTRAAGALASYAEGINYFKKYEDCIERMFNWASRQIKDFKWYGMIDFGDTLSWYRQDAYDKSYDQWGWHPEGRWGWFNCEGIGTHTGALLQFLRTGEYKYLWFGEDLSRHLMDIDTCHFNTIKEDRRLRHIFDDYSQPGSMHRHNGDHWGGRNEEASHTNLNGILLYYYITGYDRALDVAKEIGEFFLKRPITYFRHPDIAPHRAMANILWGETELYSATGDERLKKDADSWADLFYQGQNRNGSWNENYNPVKKRWDGAPHTGYLDGYTLPALIEYHQMTGNRAIGDSIVRLTKYLMKNDAYGAIFEGLAYSYFLTGDKNFLEFLEKKLEDVLSSQRIQNDPLWNGMIFQKLYYARPVEFLYFTPYAFEALLASQKEKND